jgi:hypothetical protein
MTSYSQNLQIFCICLVFFISLLGFYFPIYLASSAMTSHFKFISNQSLFILLKCCGSGVILGVALVHLLADAAGDLGEYGEYPCKPAS